MAESRLNRLSNMLDEDPNDSFLLFALAKEYEKAGQLDKALQYFLRLLRTDPSYIGAYYHLGKLYEELTEPEKAVTAYEEGMDLARRQNDPHSLSELTAARLNLDAEDQTPDG